eukprot:g6913.t1
MFFLISSSGGLSPLTATGSPTPTREVADEMGIPKDLTDYRGLVCADGSARLCKAGRSCPNIATEITCGPGTYSRQGWTACVECGVLRDCGDKGPTVAGQGGEYFGLKYAQIDLGLRSITCHQNYDVYALKKKQESVKGRRGKALRAIHKAVGEARTELLGAAQLLRKGYVNRQAQATATKGANQGTSASTPQGNKSQPGSTASSTTIVRTVAAGEPAQTGEPDEALDADIADISRFEGDLMRHLGFSTGLDEFGQKLAQVIGDDEQKKKMVASWLGLRGSSGDAFAADISRPLPALRVSFDNVTLNVNDKQVLCGVKGSFPPGSLVAVMGASGAGKTSFVNMLANELSCYSDVAHFQAGGDIRIGLTKDGCRKFPSEIGYVPQDNVLFDELTVFANIYFAAKLRSPDGTPEEGILLAVEETLRILEIAHIRDSVVGSVEKKGISGGEKKRVSMAVEMVAKPRILFLDEPTSGLDASASLKVVQCLRRLRSLNITVICIIHQPRQSVFLLFDQLLLLAKGEPCFLGKPFEAVEFFMRLGFPFSQGENIADWLLDVLEGTHCVRFDELGRRAVDYQGDKVALSKDIAKFWTETETSDRYADATISERETIRRIVAYFAADQGTGNACEATARLASECTTRLSRKSNRGSVASTGELLRPTAPLPPAWKTGRALKKGKSLVRSATAMDVAAGMTATKDGYYRTAVVTEDGVMRELVQPGSWKKMKRANILIKQNTAQQESTFMALRKSLREGSAAFISADDDDVDMEMVVEEGRDDGRAAGASLHSKATQDEERRSRGEGSQNSMQAGANVEDAAVDHDGAAVAAAAEDVVEQQMGVTGGRRWWSSGGTSGDEAAAGAEQNDRETVKKLRFSADDDVASEMSAVSSLEGAIPLVHPHAAVLEDILFAMFAGSESVSEPRLHDFLEEVLHRPLQTKFVLALISKYKTAYAGFLEEESKSGRICPALSSAEIDERCGVQRGANKEQADPSEGGFSGIQLDFSATISVECVANEYVAPPSQKQLWERSQVMSAAEKQELESYPGDGLQSRETTGFVAQYRTLCARSLCQLPLATFFSNLTLSTFAGICAGLFSGSELFYALWPSMLVGPVLLFQLIICAASLQVFCYEKRQFLREMRRESTLAYFCARQSVQSFSLLFIHPAVFAAFFWAFSVADAAFGDAILCFVLLSWYISGLAMWIAFCFTSHQIATMMSIVIPAFLSVMLGGTTGYMLPDMAPPVELLSRLSPNRWATQLWLCYAFRQFPGDAALSIAPVKLAFEKYGYEKDMPDKAGVEVTIFRNQMYLILLGLGTRVLAYLCLKQLVHNTTTVKMLRGLFVSCGGGAGGGGGATAREGENDVKEGRVEEGKKK